MVCHKNVNIVFQQMDRSDIEDYGEEGETFDEEEKHGEREESTNPNSINQLDFYQADPFAHCQSERMYRTYWLGLSTCQIQVVLKNGFCFDVQDNSYRKVLNH